MKCPYCNSTNVEESEVRLFEPEPGIGGIVMGITPNGFDHFGIKTISNFFANGGKKIKLSMNNKKRYRCLDCRKFFEA